MQLLSTLSHLFHPRRSNNHRPRILHPEGFLILSLCAFLFFLLVAIVPFFFDRSESVLGFASNITASDVISRTNEERAKLGLPPLTHNSLLSEAALAKAQNMFELQYWAHVAPDGTQPWKFFKQAKYNYSVAGENLARDFSNTPDMMGAWMASPTHKANIISPKYKEIGIAVVDGKLLGTETTLVVQLFGTPRSVAPKVTQEAAAAQSPNLAQNPAPRTQEVKGTNQEQAPAGSSAPTTPSEPSREFVQLEELQFPSLGDDAAVLSGSSFRLDTLRAHPLFSPLQLSKAFFLAIIFIIISTLIYDTIIMANRNTVRLVGKNFAHILLLGVVAFLLIFFKAGLIG